MQQYVGTVVSLKNRFFEKLMRRRVKCRFTGQLPCLKSFFYASGMLMHFRACAVEVINLASPILFLNGIRCTKSTKMYIHV